MSGHSSAGQDEKGEGKTEEPSAGLVSQQKSRSVSLPWQSAFNASSSHGERPLGGRKR